MSCNTRSIDLWYDDWRPAPRGWVWAKTTRNAMELLATRRVRHWSLDHDIAGDHLQGSDLVDWLEETGLWPPEIPMVHSANPAGKFYMERVIARHYFGAAVEEAQAYLQHTCDLAYYQERRLENRTPPKGLHGEEADEHGRRTAMGQLNETTFAAPVDAFRERLRAERPEHAEVEPKR